MKHLSQSEYLALLEPPMTPVTEEEPPFDFWDYFDAIPEGDFKGMDCSECSVTYAWNHPNGTIQHVLIDSDRENEFLVLVLDTKAKSVIGHCALSMSDEYDL